MRQKRNREVADLIGKSRWLGGRPPFALRAMATTTVVFGADYADPQIAAKVKRVVYVALGIALMQVAYCITNIISTLTNPLLRVEAFAPAYVTSANIGASVFALLLGLILPFCGW